VIESLLFFADQLGLGDCRGELGIQLGALGLAKDATLELSLKVLDLLFDVHVCNSCLKENKRRPHEWLIQGQGSLATAFGGEWGSRFCRVQKLKMLRACALYTLGKIGGTARP
jgi:hypothetical protein